MHFMKPSYDSALVWIVLTIYVILFRKSSFDDIFHRSPAKLLWTFPKIDPSKAIQRRYPLRRRDADQQMHLVFYSNYAGRLVLGGGQSNYWNTEVYPLESIKEFEQISSAWSQLLARLLKEGFKKMIKLQIAMNFIL